MLLLQSAAVIDIATILGYAVQGGASDVHLKVGLPPLLPPTMQPLTRFLLVLHRPQETLHQPIQATGFKKFTLAQIPFFQMAIIFQIIFSFLVTFSRSLDLWTTSRAGRYFHRLAQ